MTDGQSEALADDRTVVSYRDTCLSCRRQIIPPYNENGPCLCRLRKPPQPVRYIKAGYHAGVGNG